MNKQIVMLIAGGQLAGLGQSLKALDSDNKGADDLVGNICKQGGTILVAAGAGNLHTQRQAVTALRDGAQQWLDDNPE